MSKSIITAIDIGTSSIKMLVGEKNSQSITILAKEQIPHMVGVRKGEIYNPKKVAENIVILKDRVQKTKGIKIKKVMVNIGGPHLFCMKSQGLVSVSRADKKISQEDINRVLQASQAVSLPSNKQVLETLALDFIVDDEKGIKDPLGLEGIRLEAKVLLVCTFSPILENLEAAIYEAGLEIDHIIPSFLACSKAVLDSQQKELGVAVLDIGAGTTSLAVFIEGVLIDFAVFPIGAANITNDIAIGMRTDIATAEQIKRGYSSKKKKIEVGEASFSKSFLTNIIRFRTTELFSEVSKHLKRISKDVILPSGVILTGGGALLPGLLDFARKKFELPCYISGPKGIDGVDEMEFSTCAGLLTASGLAHTSKINYNVRSRIKKIFKIFIP